MRTRRAAGALALAAAVLAAAGGGAAGAPEPGALPAPVREALAAEGLPPASLSVFAQDVAAGEPLLSYRAAVPRNPASTMKLVTTLAGLHLLGPTYRWRTRVYVSRPPDADGRVVGDLILRGEGDPHLVVERLWMLLRAVRSAEVRHVAGDLVIDATYFDVPPADPAAFDGKPSRPYNVAPDAALLNFRATRFNLEPAGARRAVRVVVDPPLAGLAVDNQVELVAGRCAGRLLLRLVVLSWSEPAVRLTGRLPASCGSYSVLRVVADRAAYAEGLLRALWSELGGALDGAVRFGTVPPDAELVRVSDSPPFGLLIHHMNKFSNNVMTRNLLLTIGAERKGPPGTTAKGEAAVREWLDAEGIATEGLVLDNGSGLSREARLSARFLGELLLWAHRQPLMPEFVSSLPIAGRDGSMRRRFDREALAGRAHLKTGLLDDVRAAAGYVHTASGRTVVVAALQNYPGVHRGGGTRVQDALLHWIFER